MYNLGVYQCFACDQFAISEVVFILIDSFVICDKASWMCKAC